MNAEGKYIIAVNPDSPTDESLMHTIGVTEKVSNATEISSGAAIQYNLVTKANVKFSFVNYYFYKKYAATKIYDGESKKDYYRFVYNRRKHTCFVLQ